jgi:hypothetical protein
MGNEETRRGFLGLLGRLGAAVGLVGVAVGARRRAGGAADGPRAGEPPCGRCPALGGCRREPADRVRRAMGAAAVARQVDRTGGPEAGIELCEDGEPT